MNRKTRVINFGNTKGVKILNKKWINSIFSKIEEIGTYNIDSKYYMFLNKKNIYELKKEKLLFTLNTFGKKMLLFLVKFNNKNYSIFINIKTKVMVMSRFRFVDELFNGTLLIGTFVKNRKTKKWNYVINDICYYKIKI